ncbi:hypothetical protein IDVR_18970 [Intrasporangium sp. DVR]
MPPGSYEGRVQALARACRGNRSQRRAGMEARPAASAGLVTAAVCRWAGSGAPRRGPGVAGHMPASRATCGGILLMGAPSVSLP